MMQTASTVWHLLFILKSILTLGSLAINVNELLAVSNLLRKTAFTTTFYFATEEESACINKKKIGKFK